MRLRKGMARWMGACMFFALAAGITAGQDSIHYGEEISAYGESVKYADLPALQIPQLRRPPVMGAAFDERGWEQSLKVEGFTRMRRQAESIAMGLSGDGSITEEFMRRALEPENQTEVFLASNRRNLYIGFKCYEAEMDRVITAPIDGSVFGADSVEVFISSWEDTSRYFQFAADPGGTIFDSVNIARHPGFLSDGNWTASGLRVYAGRHEDYYIVQFMIPFRDIELDGAERARIQLCRNRKVRGTEYTSLIPTNSGFHETDKFAEINFGDEELVAPARVAEIYYSPTPLWGENYVDVTLSNEQAGEADVMVYLELKDTAGDLMDKSSRFARWTPDGEEGTARLPFSVKRSGAATVVITVTDYTGSELYDRKVVPAMVPSFSRVDFPSIVADTAGAQIILNCTAEMLKKVGTRYAIFDSERNPLQKNRFENLHAQNVFIEIDTANLEEEANYQMELEIYNNDTGCTLDSHSTFFNKESALW